MHLEVAFQLLPRDNGRLGLPGRGTTAHIPGEHHSGKGSHLSKASDSFSRRATSLPAIVSQYRKKVRTEFNQIAKAEEITAFSNILAITPQSWSPQRSVHSGARQGPRWAP